MVETKVRELALATLLALVAPPELPRRTSWSGRVLWAGLIPGSGSSPSSPPTYETTLDRHYEVILDSGKFECQAALAHHLGVSRARVTQVLKKRMTASAFDDPLQENQYCILDQ
jgi:hypothetical protein